jgi:type I restriction enzyme S subunit
VRTKALSALLDFSIGGVWGEEPGSSEAEVFVFRSTELMADGSLDPGSAVRRSITARQLGSRELRTGDLLLEKSGGGPKTPVGRVGIVGQVPGPSVCSNFMLLMRPRPDDVAPEFLHYYLNHFHSSGGTESLQNNSTNIRNLRTAEYLDLEVPVPTIDEQRRIVALLDEATQYIADLESTYSQTSALWTDFEMAEMSSIVEGLECPWLHLGQCCEILDSLRRPITKRDRRPGPVPYFGATGEVDRVAEYLFDEPLVLLGEDGAKWGRGERSAFSVDGKCWVNNHAHVLRPLRDVVLDDWLVAYLCHADLSEFITGLTVPKLNQARMREIPIPVPTLDEQEALVARLGEVGEVVERGRVGSDSRLRQLADLRQSVLEAAFRGEL